jgi:hypothetical protein
MTQTRIPYNLTALGDAKGKGSPLLFEHSSDAVPLKMSDLDDTLVRAAGDDEGQDPRYNPPD